MVKDRHVKKQAGFTLVEVLIVLAIGAAFAIGAFFVYNRQVKPTQYINSKVEAFTYLLSGLESARMINGNAYPAAQTATSLVITSQTPTPLERLLISAVGKANNNYAGWQYTCANNTLTITVSVADTTDVDLQENVRVAIANNFRDWNCDNAVASGTFSCRRNNVVCN